MLHRQLAGTVYRQSKSQNPGPFRSVERVHLKLQPENRRFQNLKRVASPYIKGDANVRIEINKEPPSAQVLHTQEIR